MVNEIAHQVAAKIDSHLDARVWSLSFPEGDVDHVEILPLAQRERYAVTLEQQEMRSVKVKLVIVSASILNRPIFDCTLRCHRRERSRRIVVAVGAGVQVERDQLRVFHALPGSLHHELRARGGREQDVPLADNLPAPGAVLLADRHAIEPDDLERLRFSAKRTCRSIIVSAEEFATRQNSLSPDIWITAGG